MDTLRPVLLVVQRARSGQGGAGGLREVHGRVRASAALRARPSGWCKKIADSTTVTTTEAFEAAEATETGSPRRPRK